MEKVTNTKAVLDSIKTAKRLLDIKIADVKREAERIRRGVTVREVKRSLPLPKETAFMRGVTSKQTERRNFLSSKRAETEQLCQDVKRQKSSTEREIERLDNELRRARL